MKRSTKIAIIVKKERHLNINKTFTLMAIFSTLLALLIIILTSYEITFRTAKTPNEVYYLLPVVSILSLSCAAMSIVMLRPLAMLNERVKQTENSLDDLNKLHNTLRAQRHDFMNHLQVVHSLIELGKHNDAGEYIDKVYTSIEKVSSTLKTGIPSVNAILEAKRKACESKGIEVSIDVRTTLSDIPIPDWELCRVFGNIIDNAVNALAEKHGIRKRINIELFEDIHNYGFRISNNGPAIPPELWERIFMTGFTTQKEAGGEGMGLAICKRIMSRYGSELKVFSNVTETIFEGTMPRSKTLSVNKR